MDFYPLFPSVRAQIIKVRLHRVSPPPFPYTGMPLGAIGPRVGSVRLSRRRINLENYYLSVKANCELDKAPTSRLVPLHSNISHLRYTQRNHHKLPVIQREPHALPSV